MALKVTKKDLGGWKQRAMRARQRLQSMSAKSGETVATVVHTAEVSSAAFIAGVVQGRYGGVEVLGIPMDLGLAAVLHVGAFMGFGGKMSRHLHGFGDGFLAAFLTTTGRGVGQAWKERAAVPAASKGEALPGGGRRGLPRGGSFLTDDERRMAAMAAAI
jgi:hypothetical protein